MAPVWEALTDILGADQLRRRRDKGEIEVAPIAFLRGRTLSHAFVIVDEAQNASPRPDEDGADPPGRGRAHGGDRRPDADRPAATRAIPAWPTPCSLLDGVKGIAVTRFEAEDVVRHPLVERIVRAYDADAAKRGRTV